MKSKNDSASAPSILIRCDGGPELGLGHVVRSLALADELRERHGRCVRFLIRREPIAVEIVEKAGHPVTLPAEQNESDRDWISRAIIQHSADALVLDFREDLSPDAVWEWRRQGVLTVSIDDLEEKRVACDLVFFPPVPQVRRMEWNGFTGELHAGWEWVLLRRQFADVPFAAKKSARPVVLIAMGGGDSAGLTLKAMKAIDALDEEFDTIIVLGGAFCHNESLEKVLTQVRRRFEIRRDVANMASVMAEADLAVASFGVTAYELAAVGVPGIFLCLTEDHAESASAFAKAGIGIVLGVDKQVTEQLLAESVRHLLRDSNTRVKMAKLGRKLSDGRGAQRIALMVTQKLETKFDRH